jgi:hypothetical protein
MSGKRMASITAITWQHHEKPAFLRVFFFLNNPLAALSVANPLSNL